MMGDVMSPMRGPKSPLSHVKKPLNAFMLYMKDMRPKVVAECTLKESAAINQILGKKVGCNMGKFTLELIFLVASLLIVCIAICHQYRQKWRHAVSNRLPPCNHTVKEPLSTTV